MSKTKEEVEEEEKQVGQASAPPPIEIQRLL